MFRTLHMMFNLVIATVNKALDFLQKNLRSKPTIPGMRVFIGEFGIPQESDAVKGNATLHEILNRDIIIKYLTWGVEFILYWEMYNNEVDTNGNQKGFWLINDKEVKLPLYYTFSKLYSNGDEWIKQFYGKNNRYPNHQEYTSWALSYLKSLSS